jgi:hypothetical protein
MVLLAASVAIAAWNGVNPHPNEAWLFTLVILALGALGGWLGVQPRNDRRAMLTAIAVLALSAIGFGLGWPVLSLPALGAGLGAGTRWGFAQHKRARWYSIAVAGACYLVSAIAALVQTTNQHGMLWVLSQGLGSLAAGYALRYVNVITDSGAMRKAADVAGRCLLIAGIALPYIALVLLIGAH